ncbi:MAG: LamG domain-containing protein [Sedimentisphaerales bacterium]|nr:LamG domain-containing protein [Sedimentisphaerales bacterium]
MRAQMLWVIVLIVGLLGAVESSADTTCGLSLGDRVICTVDWPHGYWFLWAGTKGTVVCLDPDYPDWEILVSFDDWYWGDGEWTTWWCETSVQSHLTYTLAWVGCNHIRKMPDVPDLFDGGEPDRSFKPQTLIAGKANQTFEVNFNVVNGGTGSPPDATYVDIYASRDTKITPSDYKIGTSPYFYLAANGWLDETVKVLFPTNIPVGYYYVGWIIDPLDLVPDEYDEMNNSACVESYRLLVTGASGTPCLELSAAGGGKIATPGEGVYAYPSARQVSVAASADAKCHFAGWTGTAVDAGKVIDAKAANTQVTVDSRYSLMAVFGGPHLLIDDFEDYNDASPLNAVWVDGLGWRIGEQGGRPGNSTGATIGNAETPTPGNPTVHGGAQAMVFHYSNSKSPCCSEASRRWGTMQDWAATGADTLSLWYRGAASNSPQPLYVVVEDYHGGTAIIEHSNSLAVQNAQWSQWTIPLREIQAAGVMLSRVVNICLGVGDRTTPLVIGAGQLYFDDITLMHSDAGGTPPGGEPPEVPAIDSPIAHWKLDEASGVTAEDCAGGHDGRLYGGPTWLPTGGILAGALRFNDMSYVEIPPSTDFNITYAITVAAWIKVTAFDRNWQAIVTKGDSSWRIQRDAATSCIEFACTGVNVPGTQYGNVLGHKSVNDGQWHHVAGTYDGARVALYVDGALDVSSSASGQIATNMYPVLIGENAEQRGRWWNGLIDDVRIYDEALTSGDVFALTKAGGPRR